ncbi:hypothetical protein BDV32DRAFT_140164 [Aspergillus pseudonomiae]|uniref:Epidermal growth factor receptor-like transmembrane-juxtamembrane segment domain-containing protein n=1 Tax=Aspergillus pseudonomiae TaxID=1506151 RepID=A0A5N6HV75_9EURO|nr:uncharacterized protein BDV37DRAFT_296067 [Aspergillus pseudonomiae]KAB8257744.1 hypothetical protein BDV32DRAFT_140164 [Aspergillus pseudonomiae]KAE8401740.1 hypothetical protein BDV37DRAFT_296067 [Aspergillus pseudonomiae]
MASLDPRSGKAVISGTQCGQPTTIETDGGNTGPREVTYYHGTAWNKRETRLGPVSTWIPQPGKKFGEIQIKVTKVPPAVHFSLLFVHSLLVSVTGVTGRTNSGHSVVHGTVVNDPRDMMKRQAQDGSQPQMDSAISQEGQVSMQVTIAATVGMPSPTTGISEPTASEITTDQSSPAVPTTSSEETPTASPASHTPTTDTAPGSASHDPSASPTSLPVISSASNTSASQIPLSPASSSGTPQSTSSTVVSTSTSSSSSSSSQTSSTSSSSSSSSSSTTTSSTSTSSTTSTISELTTTSLPSGTRGGASYGWDGGSGPTATEPTTLTTGPTTSATISPSQGSGALDSQTKGKIAGGVVGGVAGAMALVLLVFIILRRRRAYQNRAPEVLPPGDMTGTAVGEGSVTRSADVVSRRSSNDPLFTASYFAPAFMKRWRQSRLSTHTESTLDSSTSERGFQKISGRKIPSVLQSGGDGYGGGFSEGSPTMSEPSVSFPPGSPVLPRSPTSQPPPSTPYGMPLDVSYTREAEETNPIVIFRPSPARTPIPGSAEASLSNEPSVSRIVPLAQGALSPTIPKRPDVLGRSHPSFDGSRGSRFTESI